MGLSRQAVADLVEADGEVGLADFIETVAEMDRRHGGDVACFAVGHMAVCIGGNELLETLAAIYAQYGGGDE